MIEDSQNLAKLSDDAKALMAYAFGHHTTGWTLSYMIEVRLDDPVSHLFNGGDGLVMHGGNGSRKYAKHVGNDDWAVVHVDDAAWAPYATAEWGDKGKTIVAEMEQ